MALLNAGWFPTTWFPDSWWQQDYWLEYGLVVPSLKIRIHRDELSKLSVTHDGIVPLKLLSEDNIGRTAGEDV